MPITIILFPAQNVLDLKIASASKPEVSKFAIHALDVSKDRAALGRFEALTMYTANRAVIDDVDRSAFTKAVEVTWDHFDPGLGVKIQVIYVGQGQRDPDFRVALDGYVLGVNSFTEATSIGDTRLLGLLPVRTIAAIFPTLLGVASTFLLSFWFRRSEIVDRRGGLLFLIILLLVIVVLSAISFLILFGPLGAAPSPPV